MRKTFALAALAAASAFATPAAAQVAPRVEVDSRALILQPATLAAGNDLDFGTIVASNVAGTVTLDAATGAVTDSGPDVTYVSGAQRATFNGNGEPGQEVVVTVTSSPVLTMAGTTNSMDFTQDTDGDGTFNIRADGLFTVYVGGTIDVKAGQAPGLYEGKVYVDATFQ